jgi:hypothetical protein
VLRLWCTGILAAFMAVGCGGSDKPAATPAPPAATATTAAKDLASAGDCAKLSQVGGEVANAVRGATGDDSDQAKQLLDELSTTAPQEIRGDLQVISGAYKEIIAALKAAGVTSSGTDPSPEALQKLQAVLAKIDQAELTRANANITSWVQKHC